MAFGYILACLALGVAAIAAAGSVAEAFRQGLAAQAREILGGDLAITQRLRAFTPAERAVFARTGATAYAASAEAMAQGPSGERRLVELRGVSEAYPLAGTVELAGGVTLAAALRSQGDGAGAAVEAPLLDRIGIKLGDRFLVGNVPLVARAILVSEPDRLSRGFALGPRVLTRLSVVESGGFLGEGLPFGETARIALRRGVGLAQARAVLGPALRSLDPNGGYRIRDRSDAAPGLRRLIDELEYFLGFIGLASLMAGGLGVFGAVSAHLEAKKPSIAVLKALGAEAALVRDIYLIQIGVLALLGVVIGLAIGGGCAARPGQTRRGQAAASGTLRVLSLAARQGGHVRPPRRWGVLARASRPGPSDAARRALPPADGRDRDVRAGDYRSRALRCRASRSGARHRADSAGSCCDDRRR